MPVPFRWSLVTLITGCRSCWYEIRHQGPNFAEFLCGVVRRGGTRLTWCVFGFRSLLQRKATVRRARRWRLTRVNRSLVARCSGNLSSPGFFYPTALCNVLSWSKIPTSNPAVSRLGGSPNRACAGCLVRMRRRRTWQFETRYRTTTVTSDRFLFAAEKCPNGSWTQPSRVQKKIHFSVPWSPSSTIPLQDPGVTRRFVFPISGSLPNAPMSVVLENRKHREGWRSEHPHDVPLPGSTLSWQNVVVQTYMLVTDPSSTGQGVLCTA